MLLYMTTPRPVTFIIPFMLYKFSYFIPRLWPRVLNVAQAKSFSCHDINSTVMTYCILYSQTVASGVIFYSHFPISCQLGWKTWIVSLYQKIELTKQKFIMYDVTKSAKKEHRIETERHESIHCYWNLPLLIGGQWYKVPEYTSLPTHIINANSPRSSNNQLQCTFHLTPHTHPSVR